MFEINHTDTQYVNGAGQCELKITGKMKFPEGGFLNNVNVVTGDCDYFKEKLANGHYERSNADLTRLGVQFTYELTEI